MKEAIKILDYLTGKKADPETGEFCSFDDETKTELEKMRQYTY